MYLPFPAYEKHSSLKRHGLFIFSIGDDEKRLKYSLLMSMLKDFLLCLADAPGK